MKFSITHARDVIGFRITVVVQADSADTISAVASEMDGFEMGRDVLNPGESQYTRVFSQAGGFTPGADHVVRVTATNSGGIDRIASDRWKD